jgi:hypothetical protein
MIQRLDASGLFFCTQLSVSIFLALVFKVFRNGFRCHSRSVAELGPSKLSNFGHSVTIHGPTGKGWRVGRALSAFTQPWRLAQGPPVVLYCFSPKLHFVVRSVS